MRIREDDKPLMFPFEVAFLKCCWFEIKLFECVWRNALVNSKIVLKWECLDTHYEFVFSNHVTKTEATYL